MLGEADAPATPDAVAVPSRVPISRKRRPLVAAMVSSASIPQFWLEAVAQLRSNVAILPGEGPAPSLMDVVVASVAAALRAHPGLNTSFDGDAIIFHRDVNVALAVAVEGGIIAPVVHQADTIAAQDLARIRKELVGRARAGTLNLHDVTDATFTISNLGPTGVTRFQALVVPPQAAILAVSSLDEHGNLSMVLTCDHRAVDGAPAAIFLADVKARVEGFFSAGPSADSHSPRTEGSVNESHS